MMAPTDDNPQFVILAPSGAEGPHFPVGPVHDKAKHASLVEEMQRLRGRVALEEGAITDSMLDSSGRHRMPGDENSWHLLRIRRDGDVDGCARILAHPPDVIYPRLRIASSSAARCGEWARHVQHAVESELTHARENGWAIIEPGGWVVDKHLRGTPEAISIAVAAFAWAQILGDSIGFLTATEKHGSATILRRLGGRKLEARGRTIPGYFEPAWGCNAELLRFDTNSLNPHFRSALALARCRLLASPVFFPGPAPRKNTEFAHVPRFQPLFANVRV